MIPEIREQFNKNFSHKKYIDFLHDLDNKHPGDIVFRIAETPIFVPKDFTKKMLSACETKNGELEPQLIEMQGFPTLFGFQVYYPQVLEKHFEIPENFSTYLNNY